MPEVEFVSIGFVSKAFAGIAALVKSNEAEACVVKLALLKTNFKSSNGESFCGPMFCDLNNEPTSGC